MKHQYYSFSDDVVQNLEQAVAELERVHRAGGCLEDKTYQRICNHILEALNGYLVYRLPQARAAHDPRVKVVDNIQMDALYMPEVLSGARISPLGGKNGSEK